MKFVLYLFTIAAVISPLRSQDLDFRNFGKEITVNAKGKIPNQLALDSIRVKKFLFGTKKMEILGNHLLVIGHNRDSIFMMFSLDDFSYEGSFGLFGQGPNEFNNPIYNGFNCDTNSIVATDLSAIKVIDLTINNSEVKPSVLRTVRIPGILFPLNNAILLNDTIVLGTNITSGKEVSYFNTSTGDLGEAIDYPVIMKDVPPKSKGRVYSKVVDISNDYNTIVFAYKLFPYIRVVNVPNFRISDLNIKTNHEQIKKKIVSNYNIGYQDMITFYESVSVSDNYFGALLNIQKFDGIKGNEIQLKQVESPELQIFRNDGYLLKRYNTPGWMKIFVIDEEHSRIITFNPDQDEFFFIADLDF